MTGGKIGYPHSADDLIGDQVESLVNRLTGTAGWPNTKNAVRKKLLTLESGALAEMISLHITEFTDELNTKSGIIEDALTFMGDYYKADPSYWGGVEAWSVHEATALFLGRDPDKFQWEHAKAIAHHSAILSKCRDMRRKAKAAIRNKSLPQKPNPRQFIDWASANGYDFPSDLSESVQLNQDGPLGAGSINFADGELDAREVHSLGKAFIAMAITAYRYNPFKLGSHGPKAIANDMHNLGVPLSTNTITKLLRKAGALVEKEHVEAAIEKRDKSLEKSKQKKNCNQRHNRTKI